MTARHRRRILPSDSFSLRVAGSLMSARTSFVVCLGLVGTLFSVAHGQAPPRGSGWMPVAGFVRAIDTDTLEIEVDGRRMGLAVAGIVAPAGNTECGLEGTISPRNSSPTESSCRRI